MFKNKTKQAKTIKLILIFLSSTWNAKKIKNYM